MKTVTLIPKRYAGDLLGKIVTSGTQCYYLNDDVAHLIYLRNKFSGDIGIKSLPNLFDQTYKEIKSEFLEIISRLNKKNNSVQWWCASLTSRNLATTVLYLNVTYLFCAKKLINNCPGDIVFIVDSPALIDAIAGIVNDLGHKAVKEKALSNKTIKFVNRWLKYCLRITFFLWESIKSRIAASVLLKPIESVNSQNKKRAVIRTWVSIDGSGKLQDRNFGPLADWLKSNGYEVYIMPMFYYFFSARKTCALIKEYKLPFLIPDHYLRSLDYIKLLFDNAKLYNKDIGDITVDNINITSIFTEALRDEIFNRGLLKLDLSYAMFKGLKRKGVEVDTFYYPFENNAAEKVFILGCREFMPNSKIIGFQHTTFFPNQISYHLAKGEADYHPLPDRIICSGPRYVELHNKAGFPSDILLSGPNLRFGSVHSNIKRNGGILSDGKKIIMVPVSGIVNPAFELFVKLNDALRDREDYKVLIRNHPLLLPKNRLIKFLDEIGMKSYEFADDGVLQDWLSKAHVVISSGWSITAVESAAMGVPVIRIIPDNTFNCDPLVWPDYPLEPVSDVSNINKQLELIDKILCEDKDSFKRIASKILPEFFTKPNEENMKVFI